MERAPEVLAEGGIGGLNTAQGLPGASLPDQVGRHK